MLVLSSPAKVNLTLDVGARLRTDAADGSGTYHEVHSIFHLLNFGDRLRFEPSRRFELVCSVDLGLDSEDNLITRAARGMAALHTEACTRYRVTVDKHIPPGAGLGGGSSNAAATIVGLAHLAGLEVATDAHRELAASLGSDVPVFLAPTTASYMAGHGEHLSESLPALPATPVVLVMPVGSHSATAEVYRRFDEQSTLPPSGGDSTKTAALLALMRAGNADASSVAAKLYNSLEEAATAVEPVTAEVLAFLRAAPQTLSAQVSGSGAACFALAADKGAAQDLTRDARVRGWWAQATTFAGQGIEECR